MALPLPLALALPLPLPLALPPPPFPAPFPLELEPALALAPAPPAALPELAADPVAGPAPAVLLLLTPDGPAPGVANANEPARGELGGVPLSPKEESARGVAGRRGVGARRVVPVKQTTIRTNVSVRDR